MLQIDSVSKVYANHTALNKVSIEIEKGEIFGLLGPNGAGKTTLIRIINQITAPDSGSVSLNGQRLNPSHIADIGYLPEERGLYKKMPVGEQCIYLARLKGLSANEAKKALKFWFDRFEIGDWWNKKVEELSKGMAQKLQFITTVIHQPSLIILDEPFSGFDPINASLIKKEILRLKEEGATIMLSTHNMASVEEICDSFALINKSNKVLGGKVDKVKRDFAPNAWEIILGENSELNLPEFATQIHSSKSDQGQKVKIKLSEGHNLNQLLSALISTHTIIGAQEVIPSMDDIFIEVVNKK